MLPYAKMLLKPLAELRHAVGADPVDHADEEQALHLHAEELGLPRDHGVGHSKEVDDADDGQEKVDEDEGMNELSYYNSTWLIGTGSIVEYSTYDST